MFKWKVSGLGGKKEKSPKQARLNNDTSNELDNVKNNKVKDNNNKKDNNNHPSTAPASSARAQRPPLLLSPGQPPPPGSPRSAPSTSASRTRSTAKRWPAWARTRGG